jgi:carboxymethylenebutenolidase
MVMPEIVPAPVVLVMATIFGADRELEEVLVDYARLGFIAIAPDQFWRILPGPLPHNTEDEWERARARNRQNDFDRCVEDLERVVQDVTAMPESTGEYGIIGYCYGGRLAFIAAARFGARVAVSFHGSNIGRNLADAPAIKCPISLHYGDADPHAPIREIDSIRAALAGNSGAEVILYPGAGHGFTSPSKPTYDPVATAKSSARARTLLVNHLRLPPA